MPHPPTWARAAVLALCAAVLAGAVTPAGARTVTVFAAASLKTALDPIAARWQAGSGDSVAISYGASSLLARQIQQGAPADIFVSAAPDWMDLLDSAGLIDRTTRVDLLGNSLVLIADDPAASPVALTTEGIAAALPGDARLAMAMVDSVPAGVYGKAALTALGLWDGLADRVAQTDNVRTALALVTAGEAPLGIVYVTDARAEPRVGIVATFPADSHPPIVYPAAATAAAASDPAVQAFLAALTGPDARAVFAAQGFAVLAP